MKKMDIKQVINDEKNENAENVTVRMSNIYRCIF